MRNWLASSSLDSWYESRLTLAAKARTVRGLCFRYGRSPLGRSRQEGVRELEGEVGGFEPFGPVKNDSSLAERGDHEAVPVRKYFVIAAWRAPLTACAEKHRTAVRKLNLFSIGRLGGRRKPI